MILPDIDVIPEEKKPIGDPTDYVDWDDYDDEEDSLSWVENRKNLSIAQSVKLESDIVSISR